MVELRDGTSFELDIGDRGIGLQDMVLLEKINEQEIIQNLQTRNNRYSKIIFLKLKIVHKNSGKSGNFRFFY